MQIVDVHEAEARLSRLIEQARAGEEIVIARGDELLVKLVPVESKRIERSSGWAKGLVRMTDDFDAPVDDFADYG